MKVVEDDLSNVLKERGDWRRAYMTAHSRSLDQDQLVRKLRDREYELLHDFHSTAMEAMENIRRRRGHSDGVGSPNFNRDVALADGAPILEEEKINSTSIRVKAAMGFPKE